jgi:ABC-type polysaccharide/polyol phosphate export permease
MSLRPLLGCARLQLEVERTFWAMNVFSGFAMPLIVVGVFGQRMEADARTRLLIGSALFGVLLVVLRIAAIAMTADRVFGFRDLLATTGVSRSTYLGARVLMGFAMGALPLAALGAGSLFDGIEPPASWLWLAPFALALLSFQALGACISALCASMPSAGLAANLVTMAAFTLCPLTYPLERVPKLLAPLVSWLPPSLAAEAMASGWAEGSLPALPLLGLLAWTLAFTLATLRWFPWTDRP